MKTKTKGIIITVLIIMLGMWLDKLDYNWLIN